MNVTKEPRAWFDQIVACGLVDVTAGSVEDVVGEGVVLEEEIGPLVSSFGKQLGREMARMVPEEEGEVGREIAAVEEEARALGAWARKPTPVGA